ncbi:HesA/MoeB/ThiF family protein [Synergistaceae bacterium OttesenSCG-928-D05]|nr:HesA/MoeB/ThiF family protein [Synergistaceae bacterium OttesenSCG-928-D05]
MNAKALERIAEKSESREGYAVVPFFECREAARENGLFFREAEILALENGICPSRYERNIGTTGLEGQAKLLRSKVAVAGCGGLGGWIVEMAARMGFGEIAVADGDVFSDSNLNRQLLATEENLGVRKAEAAARRVRQLNAVIDVHTETDYLDYARALRFLQGCDIVIDALDNNSSRKDLFRASSETGIPFVHGAIGGNFGQCGVFYPNDAPLWGSADTPNKGVEVQLGNPAYTPAFVAALQVSLAVGIVTGVSEAQCRELLWFDLQTLNFQKIKL